MKSNGSLLPSVRMTTTTKTTSVAARAHMQFGVFNLTSSLLLWSRSDDEHTLLRIPPTDQPTYRLQQTGELEQVTRECGGKDGQATGEVNAIFRHVDNPHVFNYIT